MSILLSEKESCLNKWVYASQKCGLFDEIFHTITVTTKRIIISTNSDHTESRKEISLNSVAAVYSSVKKKRPWWLVGLLVILCLVGILLMPGVLYPLPTVTANHPWDDPAGLIFYFAFFLIAIPLILIFGVKTNLSLIIRTSFDAGTEDINISATNRAIDFTLQKHRTNFKVDIDPVIADEIVNTIGLILLT